MFVLSSTLLLFTAFAVIAADIKTTQLSQEIIGIGHRRLENGFLAAWDADQPRVLMFDANGRKLWTAEITIPDAARATITSVAVWPDGSVAAAGGGTSTSGVMGAFLALISPEGKVEKLVSTTPYVPWQLAISPSTQTLWALCRIQSPPGAQKEPAYNLLRAYSRQGSQMLEALPRSTFPAVWPHPADRGGLVATDSEVIVVSGTGEILTISPEGRTTSRAVIQGMEGLQLAGVAPGKPGEVYASRRGKAAPTTFGAINVATGQWQDLPALPPGPPKGGMLIGRHQDSLVLSNAAPELWLIPVL